MEYIIQHAIHGVPVLSLVAWQSEDMTLTTVQSTSAPRDGRRFEPIHELALDGDALAACGSLPGSHRGVFVVREMTGPIGIPDLTALVGDLSLLRARLALGVKPVLDQLDAAIGLAQVSSQLLGAILASTASYKSD